VISPDGKYLAYTDKTGFYLKQVENGETHPVPLPKGFEPLAESWFPDSIHMIVSWGEDAQALPSIWQISVLGGTPRKLAEGAYPRVSPDGSTIAYIAGNSGLGPNEIWLMQADGGRAQRIAGGTEAETRVGFSAVAWAPDGRRAVYVRTTHHPYNANETKIEIADSSSGRIDTVLSKPGLGQALAWANDDFLYYSVHEPAPNEQDFNLWRVRLNSGTAHPIGSALRVTSDRGLAAELSVTRDGKRLALRRKQLQGAVYLADLSNGGKRFTTPKRMTMDGRGALPFSWTPDSRAVIFVSERDGIRHIFKQSIDQTQPELLVGGNEALFIPRLNPDATALLYLVMPNPGQSSQSVRIMRMPLTGGPPQLVLEAPWILNQQCARLPSTLCVYRRCETSQPGFFAFNSVTGASSQLLPGRLRVTACNNWSLSSDGKYLNSTNLGPNNAPEIRVVSIADGSERTIVVPHWPEIGGADWAADGKSMWVVAFNRHATGFREDGTQAVLNVNLNGKITDTLESDAVRFYWAIPSPDGRRVALNGSMISSNVWLLENF
jgi:Tol biopolymer transport system component